GAQTALAEAEVDYEDKTSPAVYVKFPLLSDQLGSDTSMVIWTTTPWTLPANLAIAVHERFDYVVDEFAHEDGRIHRLVITKDLVENFGEMTGFKPVTGPDARTIKGKEIECLEAHHPFLDRTSKILNTAFVTAETGTGGVHIAPGHGQDDYVAGLQNGLEILSPVDDAGLFTEECQVPELVGVHVFKGNARVIEILVEKGALLGQHKHQHSYPHCWRSKTPIIFRAVEQFFIKIDDIREQALEEIDKVNWLPSKSRNRIYGTVESRPDWCISRQRTWGVPLPVFRKADGEWIIDAEVARKVADITEAEGTNAWFELSNEEWANRLGLPEGTKKGGDTLDVWIDSGSSHVAVLDRHPELHRPADMYIEATDQHRGWFQSSLMISVATNDAAPYKTVITHGFVVDTSGKKLAKSGTGKPMNAHHFYDKYGADNVRLWAASIDYNTEVPFSVELFEQVVDAYRRIRNTLRVLLGNLKEFDPAKDAVPFEDMTLIDQWILTRLQEVTANCRQAYDRYEFRKVYNELNQFCTVDLSSLYVDITKDRLYCDALDSPRRRASQTAIAQIMDTVCRLLAPLLSYTADESWEAMGKESSV
ncbi:MAG: isoleucine--tRNA ligase, partial [Verrucomicrobiales bacterium]